MADQCVEIPPNHAQTALGVALCIGTFLSYLPQHIKIVVNRSSEGFSPFFLLLGTVSAFCNVNNIFLLQLNSLLCCQVWDLGDCLVNSLGVWQISTQWFMFFGIFVLYQIYFPAHLKYALPTSTGSSAPSHKTETAEWAAAQAVRRAVLGHMALTAFLSFALAVTFEPQDWQIQTWAAVLGIFSMVLACMQFFPQIYKTWCRKSVGALSIPMMLMQTPGGFLFAYSIYVRPGVNWTSWITYLMSAILQGILLTICIAWHFRERRERAAAERCREVATTNALGASETSPLLGS
ncbi:hypothetical protein IWQ60_011558 [Tieghemiomyces parasiticus]|uniref:PQ loop repeat protein n=1 Tax=Tieghemiomyces parasiticus TaxID=78921 RepID=A0A9W7ZN40_9FUNG|nr:hypothetical protein IWQ60_011558 [Tieghemiomyces parasiticus]